MTDLTFAFVRRGYDPVQVDDTMAQLQSNAEQARADSERATIEANKLRQRVLELEALATQMQQEAEGARAQVVEPNYHNLGQRIGTMLTLAQEQADDLIATAQRRADQLDLDSNARALEITAAAEQQATETISRAEMEAAQLAQQSRREADSILEAAEEQASARIQEAEAHFENRRAVASQQASEFERTLSERRERAADEFQQTLAQQEAQVAAAQAEYDSIQADAERTRREAEDEAAMLLRNAKAEADQVMRSARERADHVKATSDRELAAATARRDSITAQLANVRQMLSTLGGGAAAMLDNPLGFSEASNASAPRNDITVVEYNEITVYDESDTETTASHNFTVVDDPIDEAPAEEPKPTKRSSSKKQQ